MSVRAACLNPALRDLLVVEQNARASHLVLLALVLTDRLLNAASRTLINIVICLQFTAAILQFLSEVSSVCRLA